MLAAAATAAIVLSGTPAGGGAPAATVPPTLGAMRAGAVATLRTRWYAGAGRWQRCLPARCGTASRDWGADALTEALYVAWLTGRDRSLLPLFRGLSAANPRYGPCARGCREWSDVPLWDAVAALREYAAARDPHALAKAIAAFRSVAHSPLYARGACPEIDYQRPNGATGLKTLESDANRILAGALMYGATRERAYLDDARAHYAAVRRRFYDRWVGLYTVYVLDDGQSCAALPHRFFASVNGRMIEAADALAAETHDLSYAREAAANASAAERELNDARGIFTDLQAENDVVTPLVLALYERALRGDAAARRWLVRNAAAAIQARAPSGAYGRFFDGPPPALVTMWESAGGLALAIAAGALAPARVAEASPWASAARVAVAIGAPPSAYRFAGSGVAFVGTLGERAGHARVALDGRPLLDETGIWQGLNYLSPHETVLFAWRWPRGGAHEVRFLPAEPNVKEGPSFLDLRAALTLP